MKHHVYDIFKVLFITFVITGCANLTIKDMSVCADAGVSGAACDHYLINKQTLLDKQEWDALRFGWLCVSPTDYGNIKVELEQACSLINCTYEQTLALTTFLKKIDATQPVKK